MRPLHGRHMSSPASRLSLSSLSRSSESPDEQDEHELVVEDMTVLTLGWMRHPCLLLGLASLADDRQAAAASTRGAVFARLMSGLGREVLGRVGGASRRSHQGTSAQASSGAQDQACHQGAALQGPIL
eukprot:CAMPEP_0168439760 /NCGR_PEP_ID=MMETSP0228-20121227/42630_1 /TAXON_ID=133427 /ORGANISM="Protoceratium reticulatum, Strain CCCM 535 (=CCMP 1889)" /LENGTH=127 /DNA_ID=CAMNT_0008454043 /DNA_START=392 /DNA_END=773 /DNA_ORIENTATION=-